MNKFHYEQRKRLKSFTSGNYPVKPDKCMQNTYVYVKYMDTQSITVECKTVQIYDQSAKQWTHCQDRIYCTDG